MLVLARFIINWNLFKTVKSIEKFINKRMHFFNRFIH